MFVPIYHSRLLHHIKSGSPAEYLPCLSNCSASGATVTLFFLSSAGMFPLLNWIIFAICWGYNPHTHYMSLVSTHWFSLFWDWPVKMSKCHTVLCCIYGREPRAIMGQRGGWCRFKTCQEHDGVWQAYAHESNVTYRGTLVFGTLLRGWCL